MLTMFFQIIIFLVGLLEFLFVDKKYALKDDAIN